MNVPVSEAKAKFAELIRRVEAGESIILTRNGKPVARLAGSASDQPPQLSLVGAAEGKVVMAEDFDILGPEWDDYLH